MFQKLTTCVSVVLGLVIGLVISYFAFFGPRAIFAQSLMLMHRDAITSFATLEIRLQNLADGALELRETLSSLGWKGDASPFVEVEKFRSDLAGTALLDEKAEAAEDLEKSLFAVVEAW